MADRRTIMEFERSLVQQQAALAGVTALSGWNWWMYAPVPGGAGVEHHRFGCRCAWCVRRWGDG